MPTPLAARMASSRTAATAAQAVAAGSSTSTSLASTSTRVAASRLARSGVPSSSRSFSTNRPNAAFGDGFGARLRTWRDGATRLAFGRRYEDAKIKGGVTPQEDREYRERARREQVLGATDAEGNPLIVDALSTETVAAKQREDARVVQKALKRRLRKRWGAPTMQTRTSIVTDPETGYRRLERQRFQAPPTEHKYSTATFRISHRKLQLLADQIGSGKPVDYAILQMEFSPKRAAKRVKSTLALARDHAVAKGLDRDRLVVAEAWVGKGRTFKRMEVKGRGRTGIRKSREARLSIVLREGKSRAETWEKQITQARRKARSIGTGGVVRVDKPLRNTHQWAGWQW